MDVETWILDNQLARRNVGKLTKIYLIGRRYLVEKKESAGRPEGTNKLGQNDPIRASAAIADQLKLGEKTVRRAAEFTSAVDTIVKNTGIKVNAPVTL